jgi:hypothetical protein
MSPEAKEAAAGGTGPGSARAPRAPVGALADRPALRTHPLVAFTFSVRAAIRRGRRIEHAGRVRSPGRGGGTP